MNKLCYKGIIIKKRKKIMTKKHYIQFARLIAKHKNNISNEFLRDLTNLFKCDNIRFDNIKFNEFVLKEINNNK